MFVNAIMYYKVRDATSAVSNVDDYGGSARLLAATTLRYTETDTPLLDTVWTEMFWEPRTSETSCLRGSR